MGSAESKAEDDEDDADVEVRPATPGGSKVVLPFGRAKQSQRLLQLASAEEAPADADAAKKELEQVIRLVDHNADVNTADGDGLTLLHWCSRLNKVSFCEKIVDMKANPNLTDKWYAETPLHSASANGNAEVCRVLLAAGAVVNPQDADGFTPLHEGARRGIWDVVSVLVAAKANVNLKNRDSKSPLDVAADEVRGLLDPSLFGEARRWWATKSTPVTPRSAEARDQKAWSVYTYEIHFRRRCLVKQYTFRGENAEASARECFGKWSGPRVLVSPDRASKEKRGIGPGHSSIAKAVEHRQADVIIAQT
mmetsp:Transcript_33145/g.80890  ORF Transcript_33145/g.80890 Transcript_33145/m.80890 type:complete len:308 (-) Transcript_33145:90-1013(-)